MPSEEQRPSNEKTRSGARVLVAFITGALVVAVIWAGLDFLEVSEDATDEATTTVAVEETEPDQGTIPPTTTTTPVSSSTTAPVVFAVTAPDASRRAPFTMEPYTGLGAWLDVFDWSVGFADERVGPGIVDQLAESGVQTLYIQAGKWDSAAPAFEPNLLKMFLERAHTHDISVVGWYVPAFSDPEADLERLLAISELPVDGLAVDIESTNVDDVAERNRNAVALTEELRRLLPDDVIGAIVLEPVLLEDVNPDFWPEFPWEELAPSFDVWLPMNYWTNRGSDTPWRDPHTYTVTNVERMRELIGKPNAPVHVLGGVADETTPGHLGRFQRAAEEVGAIGGSIYDVRTTDENLWPELESFQTDRESRPTIP